MSLAVSELVLPTTSPEGGLRRAARTVTSALSGAVTVAVAVAAALAVVLALTSHLAPTGRYTIARHPVLTVLSGSMSPAIRTGDIIVDSPVTAAQAAHLHVGQIATFSEGGTETITHRIVAVVTNGGSVAYRTKGDANNSADTPLRPSTAVVGVYDWKISKGGYALNALHQRKVLGLLLVSPLLWLLATWLFAVAREPETPVTQGPADPAGEAGEKQ